MTLEDCQREAKAISVKDNVEMIIVNAPVENAEDEHGPYGYCPTHAKPYLYRWAEIVETISPPVHLSQTITPPRSSGRRRR